MRFFKRNSSKQRTLVPTSDVDKVGAASTYSETAEDDSRFARGINSGSLFQGDASDISDSQIAFASRAAQEAFDSRFAQKYGKFAPIAEPDSNQNMAGVGRPEGSYSSVDLSTATVMPHKPYRDANAQFSEQEMAMLAAQVGLSTVGNKAFRVIPEDNATQFAQQSSVQNSVQNVMPAYEQQLESQGAYWENQPQTQQFTDRVDTHAWGNNAPAHVTANNDAVSVTAQTVSAQAEQTERDWPDLSEVFSAKVFHRSEESANFEASQSQAQDLSYAHTLGQDQAYIQPLGQDQAYAHAQEQTSAYSQAQGQTHLQNENMAASAPIDMHEQMSAHLDFSTPPSSEPNFNQAATPAFESNESEYFNAINELYEFNQTLGEEDALSDAQKQVAANDGNKIVFTLQEDMPEERALDSNWGNYLDDAVEAADSIDAMVAKRADRVEDAEDAEDVEDVEDVEDADDVEHQLLNVSDDMQAAAQFVAKMAVSKDPFANLTADTNDELIGAPNLTFTSTDGEEKLNILVSDATSFSANTDEGLNSGIDQVVSAGANTEDDLLDQTLVPEMSAEDVDIGANDSHVVYEPNRQPLYKIELVENGAISAIDKPEFLDEETERRITMAEEREDAMEQSFIGKIETNSLKVRTSALSLVHAQVSLVNAPDPEGKENLLSDETEQTGQIDIHDFVTGNVSELKTGTDDATVAVAVASRFGVRPTELEEFLEQPHQEIEHFVFTAEELDREERHHNHVANNNLISPPIESKKLLPTLMKDVASSFYIYLLAFILCGLCLANVYQVQNTRNLTAQLNELIINNESLEKEWLNLIATRQNLSEHSKVRKCAANQLKMVSPKTENEQVISLH